MMPLQPYIDQLSNLYQQALGSRGVSVPSYAVPALNQNLSSLYDLYQAKQGGGLNTPQSIIPQNQGPVTESPGTGGPASPGPSDWGPMTPGVRSGLGYAANLANIAGLAPLGLGLGLMGKVSDLVDAYYGGPVRGGVTKGIVATVNALSDLLGVVSPFSFAGLDPNVGLSGEEGPTPSGFGAGEEATSGMDAGGNLGGSVGGYGQDSGYGGMGFE